MVIGYQLFGVSEVAAAADLFLVSVQIPQSDVEFEGRRDDVEHLLGQRFQSQLNFRSQVVTQQDVASLLQTVQNALVELDTLQHS